ncbi:MAG: DNA adenine methylase [Rikenellaceae bacterium]
MNYIGSKVTLLPFIAQTIGEVVGKTPDSFADIFAGTGSVGSYYRALGAEVIANDLQYYSYVLNKHIIEGGNSCSFDKLLSSKESVDLAAGDLFSDSLSIVQNYINSMQGVEGFVYKNYSKGGTQSDEITRMYFTDSNAKKCDAIRLYIEQLYSSAKISDEEYFYLLSSLLYSVDKVANTASVYGAFLKNFKKSAQKEFEYRLTKLGAGMPKGRAYNMDANSLIKDIEGEVLYLDPPYNHRQYAANYHMLETIAKYDNPEIRGVSGLRDYSEQKSSYCSKNEAVESFAELIENAKFKYIFMSYNNEGIISLEDIEKIMGSKGDYFRVTKEYQRYKADNNRDYKDNKTLEYIHILKVK